MPRISAGSATTCGMRTACSWTSAGIELFARTGTGVAHCPCSNMRLASGIAPIRAMRDAGVPVGIGVDGSASNDGAQMVAEVRQALLLQRVGFGPDAMTAREALEIATLGGAKVLGRDDIGALAPGMAADFVSFDLSQHGVRGRAARSGRGAGVLRAVAGVDERDRRKDGGEGRAADDARIWARSSSGTTGWRGNWRIGRRNDAERPARGAGRVKSVKADRSASASPPRRARAASALRRSNGSARARAGSTASAGNRAARARRRAAGSARNDPRRAASS